MTDKFHWYRRAQDSIAQTALTNSKRPETFVKGVYPTHIERGSGAHLWDHSGKKYLDFICGLGTNILGYGNDVVNVAISSQLRHGASHSFPTHHEVEFAEGLKALFPFCDAFKFLKSGTEACSAAIKIARAATGRPTVVSDGYHGWSDDFVSLTDPALGVPRAAPYQRAIFKLGEVVLDETVAAVILEPVITEWSPARQKYLQELREECTNKGILLIFDEVITGLRFPGHSVASFFNITPDIIILGKALANGMPLAAVGGKYAVMNCGEYFVSSTYAGETPSLVAGKATITALQNKYEIEWLWKQGQAFLDTFNSIWPDKIRIEGYPTRGAFKGDDVIKALFWQEACLAGMLFGPSWFFNFPLAAEWKDAMVAIKAILEKIKLGGVSLKGEMPKTPFAQKTRE